MISGKSIRIYCRIAMTFTIIASLFYGIVIATTGYRAAVPMVQTPEDFTYKTAKFGHDYFGIPEDQRHLFADLTEESYRMKRDFLYTVWKNNEVRESLSLCLSSILMLALLLLVGWSHFRLLKRYRA